MKKSLAACLMILMFGAITPAFANHDHSPAEQKEHMKKKADYMLEKHDTDKDGKLSRSEHDAAAAQMFQEADTNKDGFLSSDEIADEKWQKKQEMKSEMKH